MPTSLPSPSTDPVRLSWVRRHVVGVVAIVGWLACGGVAGAATLQRYGDDHLSGERRAALTWQCENGIQWEQPDSHWRWVADEDVALPTGFETAPPTAGPGALATRTALGTLHFDSATVASFVSDGRGTIALHREDDQTFHALGCRIPG